MSLEHEWFSEKKKYSFSPAVVDMFIGECAQVVVPSVILYSLISEDDNG